MPTTTKKLISDQVLYRLYGGVPDTSAPVQEEDVWKALEQKINSTFKVRYIDTTLPTGESLPESTMIATYENVAVVGLDNGTSKATLPVIPISLFKNMGIYSVYDPNHPDFPFIPLQRGYRTLMRTDELLNTLFGAITYEPKNNILLFNKDLVLLSVPVVTMELCVMDMSQYGVLDSLPIPSDYETKIIDELIAEFAPIVPESGMVNNFTTANQQGGKQ